MVDFTDVLSKSSEAIEKPKPRPVGTYLAVVKGLPNQREVNPRAGGDPMPVLGFTYKLVSAMEVDQDALADQPPINEWSTFTDDFFLHTEGGVYALKNYLVNVLGIDGDGKTLGQMVAEAAGKQLIVKLKHEPFINKQNEADIATRVESTAHV